jgi:hypothetical protein
VPEPSRDVAWRRLLGQIAELTVARRRLASPAVCLRWLPGLLEISFAMLIRFIAGLLAGTEPRRSAELVNTGRMACPVLQHLCVLAGAAGRLSTAGGRKLRP